MALPTTDSSLGLAHDRNSLTRALRSYYAARSIEIATEKPAHWPYRRFFGHYLSLDEFGAAMKERLAARPMPTPLAQLTLYNPSFAQQCRNLYDCVIAGDVLRTRVVSMSYGGWDTHTSQDGKLRSFLPDLFGATGGLAAVMNELTGDMPGAADNLVFEFASDFGRQLAANGSLGTDHGRGNYMILIGAAVRGGVYGELFPMREARPEPADSLSRLPLQIPGADILGQTSAARVLARISDWVSPGAGAQVFPQAASAALERGVDLGPLLSA